MTAAAALLLPMFAVLGTLSTCTASCFQHRGLPFVASSAATTAAVAFALLLDPVRRISINTSTTTTKKRTIITTSSMMRHASTKVRGAAANANGAASCSPDGDNPDTDVVADHRRQIIHLNHAGSSPSPTSVYDRIVQHMRYEQAVGGYAAIDSKISSSTNDELENVYKLVAKLLNARSNREIALVESATVAFTRLFYSFVQYHNQRKRESSGGNSNSSNKKKTILVSQVEYAANLVAACQIARLYPDEWTVKMIPSVSCTATTTTENGQTTTTKTTGVVDVDALKEMLDIDENNIAIVLITHIPTNSGVLNPVEEIGEIISHKNNQMNNHNHNADKDVDDDGVPTPPPAPIPKILYLVDACQSIGQMNVDVSKIKCHGLVATGRKYLRGPRGTGFLYIHEKLLSLVDDEQRGAITGTTNNGIMPDHIDHYGVPILSVPDSSLLGDDSTDTNNNIQDILSFAPRNDARRFEFWESNVANKLGLGQAIEQALEIKLDNLAANIQQHAKYLYNKLNEMEEIHLHYPTQCGIVTFWIDGIDAAYIKDQLWYGDEDEEKDKEIIRFEVSVVPATSTPLDSSRAAVPNLVRVSVSYTNIMEDIDLFCERLSSIINNTRKG